MRLGNTVFWLPRQSIWQCPQNSPHQGDTRAARIHIQRLQFIFSHLLPKALKQSYPFLHSFQASFQVNCINCSLNSLRIVIFTGGGLCPTFLSILGLFQQFIVRLFQHFNFGVFLGIRGGEFQGSRRGDFLHTRRTLKLGDQSFKSFLELGYKMLEFNLFCIPLKFLKQTKTALLIIQAR